MMHKKSFKPEQLKLCSLKEQYQAALDWMCLYNASGNLKFKRLARLVLDRYFERIEEIMVL